MSKKSWVIGISGASGTIYARTLLRIITENFPDQNIDLVISDGAIRVLKEEEGISFSGRDSMLQALIGPNANFVTVHNQKNIGATVASGSYQTAGMVIIPCSMNTLASVAHGISDNLLLRAADVTIKERRKLILVPRETPLSEIHLENMLKLSRLGAMIVPAMPGFYNRPNSIEDLVIGVVSRVLDQMGLQVDISKRWDGGER